MNLKPILYIFMALTLVFSVSAVASFHIVEGSVSVSVTPGVAESSKNVSIQNYGSTDLSGIQLSASDLTPVVGTEVIPASAISFAPSTISVAAGGATEKSLITVLAPANQKATTYTGFIEAYYDSTSSETTTFIVTVEPVPDYSVSADTLSVAQLSSGQMVINISNTGNDAISNLAYTVSSFSNGVDTLAVTGASSATNVNIGYGSNALITLSFNPTESHTGTYTGTIDLSYGGVEKSLTLNVVVEEIQRAVSGSAVNAELVVDRTYNTTHSQTAGSLEMTNTGNYPVTATITKTDLTGPGGVIVSSKVTVSPSAQSLTVGQTKTSTVSVSGVDNSLADGTYSGTLEIAYGGDTTETVPFSLVISSAKTEVSPNEVTYPESTRDANVSTIVTIENTGDITLTGCSLSTTASDTWITGGVYSTLSSGDSFNVNVTSYMDEEADAGEVTLGNLVYACNGYTKNIPLKSNVLSLLQIDSVKVSIDDDSWESVEDGETFDDKISPGDTFELKIRLESFFDDDNGDLDIEDIQFEVFLYDLGEDGDDLEGEIDEFDLKLGKTSSDLYIEWNDYVGSERSVAQIDWEADEGDYVLYIRAYGEDEDGAEHEDEWEVTFQLEREENAEFILTRAETSPTALRAGNSFMLYASGKSIGKDSDDVKLKISSPDLGFSQSMNFEMGAYDDDDCDALDEDTDEDEDCNEFNFRDSFKVPSDIGPGTYKIKVELFGDDGDDKMDEQYIDLTVTGSSTSSSSSSTSSTPSTTTTTSTTTSSSGATTTTKKTTTTTTGVSDTGATTSSIDIMYGGASGSPSTGGVYASSPTNVRDLSSGKSGSFRDSMGYIALLSVLGIVVVIGLISLIAYVATRK